MSARQLAPLSGVLAIVLIVVGFIVGGETPDVDASAKEVFTYYNDHDSDLQIGSALLAIGSFFFLLFSTTLAGALRRARDDVGASTALGYAGGIVLTVGLTVFAGLAFTAADGADHLDPGSLQTLNALGSNMFFTVAIGTGAFLLGVGVASLKTGLLPRWLAWIGVALGVIAMTPFGFFGFIGVGLWTIVASLIMGMAASADGDRGGAPGA